MHRSVGKILLLLLLTAVPALGQYSTYSVPGSLAERRIRAKDVVQQAYQNARWQVGFLELDPRLAITDLGYISNIYSSAEGETASDLKAQGAAGLRGFFHLGPKILVSPFADLSYSWWQEQKDLRSLNESYGVQLLGDFNRLQFQIQGGQVETQRNLSSEVEVPVDVRNERYELSVQIDIHGPFSFFASAATGQSRYFGDAATAQIPGLDLAARDVDTDVVSGGVGYEFGSGLKIDLGFESTDARFVRDPGGRSNRGSGPLLRVNVTRSRLSLDLDAALRDLEFDARASGDDHRQLTGVGQLGWRFTEKLSAGLYTATQLDFSALDTDAIFEGRRSGISLRQEVGSRTRVSVFYEVGKDEFTTVGTDEVGRVDDFTSYGLTHRLKLTGRVTVEVAVSDTRRESTDPEFDRDLSSVTGRIRVGGNLLPW